MQTTTKRKPFMRRPKWISQGEWVAGLVVMVQARYGWPLGRVATVAGVDRSALHRLVQHHNGIGPARLERLRRWAVNVLRA